MGQRVERRHLNKSDWPPKLGVTASAQADRQVLYFDKATATFLLGELADVWAYGVPRSVLLYEDWATNQLGATQSFGWLPWTESNLQGTNAIGKPGGGGVSGAWSEWAKLRITTGTTSGDGEVVHLGINSRQVTQGPPPAGVVYRAKLAVGASPNNQSLTTWWGMVSHETTYPDAALANLIRCIVILARPGGTQANWTLLCRNGSGAGVESTADLGVVANDTLRAVGWRRTSTGVQGFSTSGGVDTDQGSEVTTNLPGSGNNQGPMAGIVTNTSAARQVDCDYVTLAGAVTRN